MCYLHFQPFHNIRDGGDLESLQEMRILAMSSFNSYIQRQICQELVPSSDNTVGGGGSQHFPLSMKI